MTFKKSLILSIFILGLSLCNSSVLYAANGAASDIFVSCSNTGTITNTTPITGMTISGITYDETTYYLIGVDIAIYTGSTLVKQIGPYNNTTVNADFGSPTNYQTGTVYTIKYKGNYGTIGLGSYYTEDWKDTNFYFKILDNMPPTLNGIVIDGGKQYSKDKSLDIRISCVTESNLQVFLSTSSTPPNPSDPGWVNYDYSDDTLSFEYNHVDAEVTIYVWLKDSVGNISDVKWDSILVDTKCIDAVFSINHGRTKTSLSTVLLTFLRDPTGHPANVSKLIVSNDETFGATDTTKGTLTQTYDWLGSGTIEVSGSSTNKIMISNWPISPTAGAKKVYCKFIDLAGNESSATVQQIQYIPADLFITCAEDGTIRPTDIVFSGGKIDVSSSIDTSGNYIFYGIDLGIFKKPDNLSDPWPSAFEVQRIETGEKLINIENFGVTSKYEQDKIYTVGYRILYLPYDASTNSTIIEGSWVKSVNSYYRLIPQHYTFTTCDQYGTISDDDVTFKTADIKLNNLDSSGNYVFYGIDAGVFQKPAKDIDVSNAPNNGPWGKVSSTKVARSTLSATPEVKVVSFGDPNKYALYEVYTIGYKTLYYPTAVDDGSVVYADNGTLDKDWKKVKRTDNTKDGYFTVIPNFIDGMNHDQYISYFYNNSTKDIYVADPDNPGITNAKEKTAYDGYKIAINGDILTYRLTFNVNHANLVDNFNLLLNFNQNTTEVPTISGITFDLLSATYDGTNIDISSSQVGSRGSNKYSLPIMNGSTFGQHTLIYTCKINIKNNERKISKVRNLAFVNVSDIEGNTYTFGSGSGKNYIDTDVYLSLVRYR